MKKVYTISLLLCFLIGNINLSAQNKSNKEQNPLNYPYYIYGEQQITGPNSANLKNIIYKGFASEVPAGSTLEGKKNSEEKFIYTFEDISTFPEINLEGKHLQYWRQLEGGVWMSDIESGNGISRLQMDYPTSFLLVLDCSKSLGGSGFSQVKKGAILFIEQLSKASLNGNIEISIVCFSSNANTKSFEFAPLTSDNKFRMINFINAQNNDTKATAMYSAINKGINSQIKYAERIDDFQYEGSHILVFTDGLDNASQIEEKQLFVDNEVYNYVKEKIHSTEIKNKKLDSWVIGVQGDDVQDVQLNMMRSQLETIASTPDQFIWCDNINKLADKFYDIATKLTSRWKNLYCTSALNQSGAVCWTLGTSKIEEPAPAPAPTPKPKTKSKHMLLGLNYGIGFCDSHIKTGIGFDFAYPITKRFGLGTYLSGGYPYVQWGLLTTIGNYHDNKAAFIYGLGLDACMQCDLNFDIRAGVLLKKGLYLMVDVSSPNSFAMTFNVGYNFGTRFNVR